MARLGHTRRNRAGGRSGGRSVGFRLKSETRGMNELERRMRRIGKVGDVEAVLKTIATSGVMQGKTVELQSRSAWDNARLWADHRARGRDPFVYDLRAGTRRLLLGANRVIHGTANTMTQAALSTAQYMLEAVEHNVFGEQVRMPPLSEKYRRWKEKYFYGKPGLVLTGQLMKSLKPHVVEMG